MINSIDARIKMDVHESQFKKGLYARNVWDMQLWEDKIYIGQGNSSNAAPDANAGPVPVTYYNINTRNFGQEFMVDEEQIDSFKVVGTSLMIPGHDAREDWMFGNYYKLEADGWKKYRNIPKAIHVYDLLEYKDKMFAAVGHNDSNLVYMSTDCGMTWKCVFKGTMSGRAYNVFEFKGEVYACSMLIKTGVNSATGKRMTDFDLHKFDGIKFVPFMQMPAVCPGMVIPKGFSTSLKMTRVTKLFIGQALGYIIGSVDNDHQSLPICMYTATNITAPRMTVFPELMIPMDILSRGDKTYVLGYLNLGTVSSGAPVYVNWVFSSKDLINWVEFLKFEADTFARSFEECDGKFYFGLGCNTKTLSESTGRILVMR